MLFELIGNESTVVFVKRCFKNKGTKGYDYVLTNHIGLSSDWICSTIRLRYTAVDALLRHVAILASACRDPASMCCKETREGLQLV